MVDRAPSAARLWREHLSSAPAEPDISIGVAGSFTAEPVEAALGLGLLEAGWAAPLLRFADYNQLHQLCLDPEATLGGPVDHIVTLWRVEDVFADLTERFLDGDDAAGTAITEGVGELGQMLAQLAGTGVSLTVSTPPAPRPWGVDAGDPRATMRLGSLHRSATEAFVGPLIGAAQVSWVDVDALVRSAGERAVYDDAKWAMYRQPFANAVWDSVGSAAAAVVARQHRPAPKCIVLDCDNTLWGGVIGEDGLSGIALGTVFPGSAFSVFQRRLKQLREAGVLLAVASKNDHAAVQEVFDSHDGMVLSSDDIASWRVNWAPKSQNIAEIAAELNIGIDSLVFVDDSSYELAEVAAAHPDVERLQVPEDLEDLPSLVGRSGLFRHLRVSAEDRARTSMMLAEAARRDRQAELSPEDFLHSLELKVEFFAPEEVHVARVAQLTNKTNQFNLTTIRRTEADISGLLDSDDHAVRAIRVSDRFGDYGLVGLAIVETGGDQWVVETFLMSCRVLGRGVDTAFLAGIVADAGGAGAKSLQGRYVPTVKNGQVADFYQRHGFEGEDETFTMVVADGLDCPGHITLAR